MLIQISKEDINVIFSMIDKYNIDDEEMDAIERLECFGNEREDWEEILTLEQIRKLEKLEDLFYEALQTYIKKNIDYGDSFSKTYAEFGMVAPVIRINDKVERLKSIIANDEINVEDESIRDTLMDLANYAFMTVVEWDDSSGFVNSMTKAVKKLNERLLGLGEKLQRCRPKSEDEDIPLALDKDGEPIVPKEIKPGLKTGEYRGYQIYIRHIRDIFTTSFPSGYYCGYVAIPFSHPYYGIRYQFIDDLDVHGGLTFSGTLHDIAPDKYLLGFDCGHGGDDIKVQNEDYTLAECKRLVDQLIEVETKEYTEGDKLNI